MNFPHSIAAAIAAAATGTALAGLYPTYPLGAAPGTWQVDRYSPATFANAGTINGRANVLDLGLADADSRANRLPVFSSTFYNTQGRGFAINAPAYAVAYGSVYLPSAWTTSAGPSTNRRTDMWGVVSPTVGFDVCPGSNCNLFPILDFTNADPVAPLTTGGTGRYRVFDSNIGFVDLATPVAYDQWSDMCIAFTGADFRHYLNGVEVYVQSNITQADATFGPLTQISNHIVQGYNFGGANWSANWSGLGSGSVTSSSASTGSGQTTAPSTAFATPLTLLVLDAAGAPLPCVPVTFAAPGAGASASLSAASAMTNRNGLAIVNATANATLGSYNVTAQAAGGIATVNFALTNAIAPPAGAVGVPAIPPAGLALLALLFGGIASRVRRRR